MSEIKKNGIYKITNINNGKIYIGSSFCLGGFNRRWIVHKSQLNKGRHHNSHLQSAWNKYGNELFKFEIIEIVEDSEIIFIREQYYIDYYQSFDDKLGYNLSKRCVAPMLGLKHTEEAKKKIGLASIGNKYALGFKHSDETKKKMSDSRQNITVETRQKRSRSLMGNKNSLGFKSVHRKQIYQMDIDNNIIKLWDCMTIAASNLNLKTANICKVCKGLRKTTGGYKWKYYE